MNNKEVKNELDKISSTICLSKWLWVTMHMGMNSNHSCFHPPIHKWDLEECKKNPNALHNTKIKKLARKMMLEGKRPDECEYCWNIENLNKDVYSDRILVSGSDWALPSLDTIKNMKWDEDIYPTYLEISFSNICNCACSYCSPGQSSRWENEVKKYGSYPVKDPTVQKENLHPQLKEQDNPFVKIFWDWFPDAYPHLKVLRVTGGEPLLTDSFFKMVDYIENNSNAELVLAINTNLAYSEETLEKFIKISKRILKNKNIKKIDLFTSMDTWGKQAEYIRYGLNVERFEKNLLRVIDEDLFDITFMVTFGALSIFNYKQFIDKTIEWKKRSKKNIDIDPALLINPTQFDIKILSSKYKKYFDNVNEHMKELVNKKIYTSHEFNSWSVIYNYYLEHCYKSYPDELNEFFAFFKEYDKRRDFDFNKIFPEVIKC